MEERREATERKPHWRKMEGREKNQNMSVRRAQGYSNVHTQATMHRKPHTCGATE